MLIRLLGGLDVQSPAGTPVRLPTRKAALLLAMLALVGPAGIRRETAAELLWPDRGEAQARGSLRQALAAVRRELDGQDLAALRISGDGDVLRLDAGTDDVDALRFERLLSQGDSAALVAAAALYCGDLLGGVALPESLERWLAPQREAMRRKALDLCDLASRLGADAPAAAATTLAERLLATDETAEEAHRAIIRVHLRHGRRNAALKQLERCREALRRELDAEPEAATVALLADDDAGDAGPGDGAAPAMAAHGGPYRESGHRPSIVVLPFENLGGPDDSHFVDGVVDEVTSALSRIRDFFVIARQSAFAFKGRAIDIREIARQLGVDYVVEGTVRRAGHRVRIAVRLADAERAAQIWSDRYELDAEDVFEVQDRIAAQVAGAIRPALREAEIALARRRPTSSLNAYDRVLRALPLLWSQNAAANGAAIALLSEAVAVDADYGRAHALLAWCHSQALVYLWSATPEDTRRRVGEAVRHAAGLIDDDPLALTAAGAALSQLQVDQDPAAAFIERALQLDPNNAWAWARYGYVALYRADPASGRDRFRRALDLSPLDPFAFNIELGIAGCHGLEGNYAGAARIVRRVLAQHPGITWAYRQLAYFAALEGDLAGARDAAARLRAAHPQATIASILGSHPMRHLGDYMIELERGLRLAGLPEG
ncbi:MAG: hypothetical protein IT561_07600 [Alphaproteobacteria bacterium]|nr:hypothetical protein [Alphaproteobacteria bacterium]